MRNPFLLKLSFEDESLDFHPDLCLLPRGQLFKHFHQAHEVVFIAVLWFFNVGLYSSVTFRRIRTPLHPHSVTLDELAAARSGAVLVV